MRKTFVIVFCFMILILAVACDSSFSDLIINSRHANGEVLIRLAGSNGRTIMPSTPVFSRYELILQQEGSESKNINADDITGAGVSVALAVGDWAITLNAYQKINGKEFIAAQGAYALSITPDRDSYIVEMELNPISIEDAAGVFSFNIALPADADTAVLSLEKNNAEIEIINLKDTNTGSIELSPGYYDLSVILTKGEGQYAGAFESVHIYSGLESAAVLDLSNIEFAEKVYLMGALGGIRIGTVIIAFDEDGSDVIKEIELDRSKAKRSNIWFTDISASHIGKKLFVILEFNGEKEVIEINKLESKGSAGINLDLIPLSAKYINLAEWYSEFITGESEITVDFGFDVSANFIKLTFDDGSNYIEYFPQAITAAIFNSGDFRNDNLLPIVGFEIYNAADRNALIDAIEAAQDNCDSTITSADGSDIFIAEKWVSEKVKADYQTVINNAKAALDDPMLTDAEITEIKETLSDAVNAFNSAKTWGKDSQINAEDFNVIDGYSSKYVVQLKKTHPMFKYQIYMADSADGSGGLVSEKTVDTEGDINVDVDAVPGITRHFKIKVFFTEDNREVYEIIIGPYMTIGTAVLSYASGYSYSTLTAVWAPVQMADNYRVIYNYQDGGWITPDDGWKSAEEFERDADGNYLFTFKPDGYNEIVNSGKTLYTRVLSTNYATGDYSFSNDATKRLIGHAALSVSASQAMSINSIDVTWNALEGANGYYVSSRQYDLTNSSAIGANTFAYVSGNSYTLTNLSDDGVVQGYPYRFVVVPVINASDMSYSGDTYTLTENGEEITFGAVSSVESVAGFAIGFAANVTASKGTYASSGNVNDRIEITWEKPYLLRDAGLQYRIYRKAYNSSTWEDLGTTGAMSHIDNVTRGVMYEYVVGLFHHVSGGDIRGPSRPDQSSIFIASERAKMDNKNRAKFQGFIQNTVTMNNVTRGENADANAQFGEIVTWNGSGVAYGGSDINWGVDGYTVYVMNRNISNGWHTAMDNITTNSVLLTPSNTPSVNNTVGVSRNVLFVMRDFKHFFKARSYSVRGDGVKIYSPDPEWTYTYRHSTNQATHISNSNAMQNDFVKWGARQVTSQEFIRISMLFVARGLSKVNGTGWSTGYFGKSASASTGLSGSGSLDADSNFGVTEWEINFKNYKEDIQARCGQWVTFVTVNGRTRCRTGAANQYPQRYREQDGNTWLNIIGPWDVPHLYTGRIKIGTGGDNASTNLHWGSGQISIQYPSGTDTQNFSWRGEDSPLPYTGRGDNRHDGNDWR